tara:strand:- start:97 stop:2220 length:2124 start_codon:yes stop_codon:yes gene_type:complete
MGRFSDGYPDLSLPDSKKDEQWHKDFIKGIINDAVDGRYEFSYRTMQESYDFYDGTQTTEEVNFLQESDNGDTLPAIWINYNKIRVKVDTLIGELSAKGFQVQAKAINKDAIAEKLKIRNQKLGKIHIKEDLEELEFASGLPTAPVENLPETEEELDDFMATEYKGKSELVMEAALRYLIRKYKWEMVRLDVYKDLIITGRCFVKTEIINGLPTYRRIDPRYMVFDESCKDDFLSDSTRFGEIQYIPLADAKQIYNLTKKEVEEIQNVGSSEVNNFLNNSSETTLEYVTGSGSDMKVLVFHAEWLDTKRLKRKKSVDKFGNEHYKKVKDNYKGKDCVQKDIKAWRKGSLIGGCVVRNFGFRENMPRSVDDIYDTKSSYSSLCHGFTNNKSVSKVDLMKGLQKFKNIALYNMQLAMNRAGSKGFMYDISQIPEGWNIEEVLYYLKTSGIGVYNSKKDGIHSPGQAFNEFDMTLSQSIGQYITFSRMIDEEMNEVSGINAERMGNTPASQAVGVTQSAIMSSQTSTEPMFSAFNAFSEEIMNNLAGLVKITYGHDKDIFAPIIGDSAVDFLNSDIDLHLNDYGVFIEVIPPMLSEARQFQEMLTAAIQTKEINISDALDFIRDSKDVDYAIRKLKRIIDKRNKERQGAEMQAMQQQEQARAQSQQQMMQQQQQMKMAEEQMKGQRLAQSSEQGHQNRMKETVLKERLKG